MCCATCWPALAVASTCLGIELVWRTPASGIIAFVTLMVAAGLLSNAFGMEMPGRYWKLRCPG